MLDTHSIWSQVTNMSASANHLHGVPLTQWSHQLLRSVRKSYIIYSYYV
jgi:hypothetical protein